MTSYQSNQSMIREREHKEFEINISAFIKLFIDREPVCHRVLTYSREFMKAAIKVCLYDDDDKTIEMVENGRLYYVNQRELFLSKTVRNLLYLNSLAKLAGEPIIQEYVNREDYHTCIDLISCFDRALCDFFHDDYTDPDPVPAAMAA